MNVNLTVTSKLDTAADNNKGTSPMSQSVSSSITEEEVRVSSPTTKKHSARMRKQLKSSSSDKSNTTSSIPSSPSMSRTKDRQGEGRRQSSFYGEGLINVLSTDDDDDEADEPVGLFSV